MTSRVRPKIKVIVGFMPWCMYSRSKFADAGDRAAGRLYKRRVETGISPGSEHVSLVASGLSGTGWALWMQAPARCLQTGGPKHVA